MSRIGKQPIPVPSGVDVKIEGDSPWLRDITELSLPIAHGEGRYFIDTKGEEALLKKKAIVGRYVKG